MIRKVLIANRGEIACRITRTCHEMGIAVVAVYSDADCNALHVEAADEALCIGPSEPAQSYLNQQAILEAASRTGVDAIHPGFGFLAENAAFAQAVLDAGLIFVGPRPAAIEAMGKKRAAKLLLKDIPVVPGYTGEDQSAKALIQAAEEIGYPIMVKASAGGGGKGMRQVERTQDLPGALAAARREAAQAFGDDTLILERVLRNPRHVEVQIFGDEYGNVIALGERECSIQRRYQKIIEETPSTALTPELRARMLSTAVSIGHQLGYISAGTIEFLVDETGSFYFMEMNTRLQVEHTVTELVTGIDLVRWQILVAEGHPLPQKEVQPQGHAVQARIYAEDPQNDFLPVTGSILRWAAPPDVRVDTGIRSGDEIGIHYDPMLAKVIAYGEHREGAIRRLERSLGQLKLLGIRSNIPFLRRVLLHPDYVAGKISTAFIDQHPELFESAPAVSPFVLTAAALSKQHSLGAGQPWRNNPNQPLTQVFSDDHNTYTILLSPQADGYRAQIAEARFNVRVIAFDEEDMVLEIDGHRRRASAVEGPDDQWWVSCPEGTFMLRWISPFPQRASNRTTEGSLRAPMPGKVVSVLVKAGQQVEQGELLLTLEAMKMEHRIQAPYAGTVEVVYYKPGDTVLVEAPLLALRGLEKD